MKKCPTCKRVLPIDNFALNKSTKDGLAGQCKECKKAYDKKYRQIYKDKVSEVKKRCYNRKKSIYLNKTKKWAQKNKEKCRVICKNFQRRKRATPQGRIDNRLSNAIRYSFLKNNAKKNGGKWRDKVGYTSEELKKHIESLFTEGMTWEKFMDGEIHIDHIIPKSFFYYTSENDDQFKQCWALSNLRPLWAKENFSKNDFLPDGSRAREKNKILFLNEPDDISAFDSRNFDNEVIFG